MANPEHIALLLKGVESWNARRRTDPFIPDLSCLRFYEKFREKGQLDRNGQVHLNDIDLSGANLFNADLRYARLLDANVID